MEEEVDSGGASRRILADDLWRQELERLIDVTLAQVLAGERRGRAEVGWIQAERFAL